MVMAMPFPPSSPKKLLSTLLLGVPSSSYTQVMLGTDLVDDGRDKFRDGRREVLLDGGCELFREAGSELPWTEKEERRG